MEFCKKKIETLYGEQFVTPNMHLNYHLHDCILDFGPIYSFWLFGFERENGILWSYKKNKKSIEIQLMNRFLKESWTRERKDEINTLFISVYEELYATVRDRGTLGEIAYILKPSIIELSSQYVIVAQVEWDISDGIFAQSLKSCSLTSDETRHLHEFYSVLYSTEFDVCTSVQEGKNLYLNGSVMGSKHSRSVRSSYIMAYWCNDDGTIAVDNSDLTPHPGQIIKFCKHCIIVDGIVKCHFLAKVQWYKRLSDSVRYVYGKPIEAWSSDVYVQDGPSSYIPVHMIKSRFVFVKTRLFNKNVIVVSPRERHIL